MFHGFPNPNVSFRDEDEMSSSLTAAAFRAGYNFYPARNGLPKLDLIRPCRFSSGMPSWPQKHSVFQNPGTKGSVCSRDA